MKKLKYLLLLILCFPVCVFGYNKAVVDVTKMDIQELEEALDKGYLTSELLVKLYLDRIEEYDKNFNAIREINPLALEEAKKLDEERVEGKKRSSLHGIPILVKTNIDVKGLPTTAGSRALKDNYPLDDSFVVSKLKEKGAIILASTNMSEFAFSAMDSRSSYGTVKNAYNLGYTPYGSSGGSAVGVALSFGAASLGTDTNSSVRLPAAAAGLFGLRPSLGLVSRTGVIPYDTERDTVGIITKSVIDNALILDTISGYDPVDLKSEDITHKKYTNIDEDISNIKVGLVKSYIEGSNGDIRVNRKTDDDILNLINEKLGLLRESGMSFVEIDKMLDSYYVNIANSTMSGITFCDGFNKYIKNTTGTIRDFYSLSRAKGKIYSVSGYLSGCNGNTNLEKKIVKKQKFEEHVLDVMNSNDVDVVVYPVFKSKQNRLNDTSGAGSPSSSLSSVIGYPSITVPIGFIDGLPYSLELMSKKYDEEVLYSVALAFEKTLNMEVSSSPLVPSLYEVPDYIYELINLYEKYYDEEDAREINREARTFWQDYSSMNEEEVNSEVEKLKLKYEDYEYSKNLEKETKKRSPLTRIYLLVFSSVLVYLFGYRKQD